MTTSLALLVMPQQHVAVDSSTCRHSNNTPTHNDVKPAVQTTPLAKPAASLSCTNYGLATSQSRNSSTSTSTQCSASSARGTPQLHTHLDGSRVKQVLHHLPLDGWLRLVDVAHAKAERVLQRSILDARHVGRHVLLLSQPEPGGQPRQQQQR